ncbi:hypothetical protein V5799_029643 [Amblyomma americanum]|uniref:Uncharacterized protein n=1 Tax=Amblyomma americanum TaxID=6943 RepID=A0AAQ4EQI1_AMBAM
MLGNGSRTAGKYEYQLDKSMSWGTILSKMEQLKATLGVEDIWLSPMTLEDIFSDLAAHDRQSVSEEI